MPNVVALPASPTDLPAIAQLFRAYSATLTAPRDHAAIARDIAALPGAYAPPRGALLIARSEDAMPLGCVALRPCPYPGVAGTICEMKRLWVAPEGRGQGLGKALTRAIIEAARERGYSEMYLDTLDHMAPAIALYQKLGFTEIAPYYERPIDGTIYMGLKL